MGILWDVGGEVYVCLVSAVGISWTCIFCLSDCCGLSSLSPPLPLPRILFRLLVRLLYCRYLFNDLKGWSWAVSFVSEPGNLLPLEPIYTGLTGQLITGGGKVADAGYVFVTTPQEGNGNTWYNYKNMPVMKQDTLRNVYVRTCIYMDY